MDFKRGQLGYFVTVAEEGQITRAARRLNVAQPALTQAIRQLESDLGVELLERHARGVSLTAAGETFLPKARAAVALEQNAVNSAESLLRREARILEIGFVGAPPTANAADLLAAFAARQGDIELTLRDLPFPCGCTAAWLEEVDVAFAHLPAAESGVCAHTLRAEPRAVIADASHPLAERQELAVAEVLDETFIRYHPDVQPQWAGFHSLDDHRGGPPRSLTVDRAKTSMQMLAIMTASSAITVVPLCDGALVARAFPQLRAIPLRDAEPAQMSMVWRTDNPNALIGKLVATAETTTGC